MIVKNLPDILPVNIETTGMDLQRPVTGVYCGDLLSLVMANAREGNIWITIQNHINVIAVASLVEISAIIVVEGITVTPDVIEKAREEEIAIFTTKKTAYDIASICARKLEVEK